MSNVEENIKMDIETEDELSDPSMRFRITQRHSAAGQITQAGHDPTPYANVSTFRSSHKKIAKKNLSQLQHLAELIRKPSMPQRPPSVGVPTSPTNTLGTLFAISPTPGNRRPLQVSLTTKSNPATPYATRALQQRRATPGRSRYKSGRMQRETPRDTLRNLSKSRFAVHSRLH